MAYRLTLSVVSRSARAETDLLFFLVTLAFLLTLATRGLPSGSVFSVLLSSKLARLAVLRVVRVPRPRPRPPRFLAMGVDSMRLASVLLSSASRVWLLSWGDGGVTVADTLEAVFWSSATFFCSSRLVSRYSAIS